MADLTFQSQQMAAEQSNIGAAAQADASAAVGSSLQRGVETYIQQKNIGEERADRNRQNEQENQLNNRRADIMERQGDKQLQQGDKQIAQGDRRAAAYEQEIALNQERFSLQRLEFEQLTKQRAVDLARMEIEQKDRERQHNALKAITDDQLAANAVKMSQLEVQEKELRLMEIQRAMQGKPEPRDVMRWLSDPETQYSTGMRLNAEGVPVKMTDKEKGELGSFLGRRESTKIVNELVKSVGEFQPELAAKLSVIGIKLANGKISTEEAETQIEKMMADSEKARAAAETPKGAAVVDAAKMKVRPADWIGQGNEQRVVDWIDANGDQIAEWFNALRDPKRPVKFTREQAVDRMLEIVNNPFHPEHERWQWTLQVFNVVPPAKVPLNQTLQPGDWDQLNRNLNKQISPSNTGSLR